MQLIYVLFCKKRHSKFKKYYDLHHNVFPLLNTGFQWLYQLLLNENVKAKTIKIQRYIQRVLSKIFGVFIMRAFQTNNT